MTPNYFTSVPSRAGWWESYYRQSWGMHGVRYVVQWEGLPVIPRNKTAMLWDDYCVRVHHCGHWVTLGHTTLACPTHSLQFLTDVLQNQLLQFYCFLLPFCSSHVAVIWQQGQKDGWCARVSCMHDTHTTTMTLSELIDHDACCL